MLTVGGALTGQTLNVVSNEVSGTLSVNGTPVTCASGTYATLSFKSMTSAASFNVLVDYAVTGGAFDSFLPADTYAVSVNQYESGACTGLPNGNAPVGMLTVGGPLTGQQLTVVSNEVSGTLSVNGTPLSCASGTYGTLTFTSTASAASFSVLVDYAVTGGTFDGFLPADTYAITVSQYESGACKQLPNGNTPVGMLTVGGTLSGQTLNVASNEVSGTLSVNGTPVSCTSGTYAVLTFTSTTGASSFIALVDYAVSGGAFDGFFPADSYAVTVSPYQSGSCMGIPAGNTPVGMLTVGGTLTGQALNLVPPQTYPVSGTVTANGTPVTCASNAFASITFASNTSAATFLATVDYGTDTGGAFSTLLPADTYKVTVSPLNGACSGLPDGTETVVCALQVP